MNRPLKWALLMAAVAVALLVVGFVIRVLRWLLYIAIVALVIAAGLQWLGSRASR